MIGRIIANPGRSFEVEFGRLGLGVTLVGAEHDVADGEHVVRFRIAREGVLLSQDEALLLVRGLAELIGCEVINVSS